MNICWRCTNPQGSMSTPHLSPWERCLFRKSLWRWRGESLFQSTGWIDRPPGFSFLPGMLRRRESWGNYFKPGGWKNPTRLWFEAGVRDFVVSKTWKIWIMGEIFNRPVPKWYPSFGMKYPSLWDGMRPRGFPWWIFFPIPAEDISCAGI